MRALNLSNYRLQDAPAHGWRAGRFALWSDFRSALVRRWPHHILAWYLLVIGASIGIIRTPQGRLGWISLGIAALGIGEFCVAGLADAAETYRHLFIFHACTDLTVCFGISSMFKIIIKGGKPMNNHAKSFSWLVSVLVLTCSFAFAQSTSLSGSFGFQLNAWSSPISTNPGLAFLGVMNFDGAGNATGTYTVEVGADNAKPPQNLTGTFTGTYSINADGTGSMAITLDIGFILPFTMVIAEGGQSLQLVATDCSGGCDIGGLVISGSARAAYAGSPNGSYAFQLRNSPEPVGTIGVATFDGAGNVAVTLTVVAAPHGGGSPPIFSGTLPGTYSINPDGSGAINLNGAPGQLPDSTYSFVVTDGGSGLLLLQTAGRSGTDTNVSFGTARLQ